VGGVSRNCCRSASAAGQVTGKEKERILLTACTVFDRASPNVTVGWYTPRFPEWMQPTFTSGASGV
jgi:hypothetical protein